MSLPPSEIPLGAIRFNSDSQKLEYWMGSAWMQIKTFSPNLDGGARGVMIGGHAHPSYYNTIDLPNVKHSNSFFMNGYRASIIIKKTQSLNYFGSIAKGYKSGGVNQQPYINDKNRNYGPEELRTFEFGVKYFSDKIYTNINLFHGLRANQQISISSQQIEGDPNSFIFLIFNNYIFF